LALANSFTARLSGKTEKRFAGAGAAIGVVRSGISRKTHDSANRRCLLHKKRPVPGGAKDGQ
jgi:hypothetical protein